MNLFKIEHIYLDLDIQTKQELFEFISKTLQDLGRITDQKDFKEALEKRESDITTGLGDGLAIPHALDTSVLFPTLIYIRLKNPLDYDAIDQKPVTDVHAIAMPNSYQKEHLALLSQIAQIYLDEETKLKLTQANTQNKVFNILSKNLK